jgi:protein-S-isoprenylcysteine O-methyltransferase Ste14
MSRLFWKAVLAFVMLPGIVAFAVPLWLLKPHPSSGFRLSGSVVLALGILLLLACVRDFYIAGRGTLAPWSPPQQLVVTGMYRWSRNPMYIAVVLILWGWALGFQSQSLAVYALAMMLAFHLRVIVGEEPWLARHYGEQWSRYEARVPRWLGPL